MKNYIQSKIPLIDKEIDRALPLTITQNWIKNRIGVIDYKFDQEVWEKTISQPFYHMFDSGGKRFRPILTCLTHDLLGGKSGAIYELSIIPELIHSGTLIVDDIEDESIRRRNHLCVYQKYGTAIAVNNGNFLYYFAQKLIDKSRLTDPQKLLIYQLITNKLTILHLGQAMDIWWSQNGRYQISQEEYMQMTAFKTGALLSVAMQIGAIAAGQYKDLELIDNIARGTGVAFQIKDDILNLKPSEKWGKDTGEDITEGKISLLVINTLKKAGKKDNKRLIDILRKKTKNKKFIKEAIDIIDKYDSFDFGINEAKKLIKKAQQDVEANFNDNKYRKILLEILDYSVGRDK